VKELAVKRDQNDTKQIKRVNSAQKKEEEEKRRGHQENTLNSLYHFVVYFRINGCNILTVFQLQVYIVSSNIPLTVILYFSIVQTSNRTSHKKKSVL